MRIVVETTGRIPTLKEAVASYVQFVYEECGRNKSKTARALGVSVRTVRTNAEAWGLKSKKEKECECQSAKCPHFGLKKRKRLETFKQKYVEWAFECCDYNKAKTARALGINPKAIAPYKLQTPFPILIMKRRRMAMNRYRDEDFAQWIVDRMLRGVGLTQNIGQSWIDYLRESRGVSQKKRELLRVATEREMEGIENVSASEPDAEGLDEFIDSNPWIYRIPERLRVVICLLAMGMEKVTIAKILGVDPRSVSTLCAEIREEMEARKE